MAQNSFLSPVRFKHHWSGVEQLLEVVVAVVVVMVVW